MSEYGDYSFTFIKHEEDGSLRRSIPIPIEPDWSDISDITLKHGSALIGYVISHECDTSNTENDLSTFEKNLSQEIELSRNNEDFSPLTHPSLTTDTDSQK